MPETTEGVPEIEPVLDEIAKPAGNDGDIEYTRVGAPSAPVTGVQGVAAMLYVKVFVATACVAVGAA